MELECSRSQNLLAPKFFNDRDRMEAKYFQIIFFIVALIITAINIYDRFFTKRVITNHTWFPKKFSLAVFTKLLRFSCGFQFFLVSLDNVLDFYPCYVDIFLKN